MSGKTYITKKTKTKNSTKKQKTKIVLTLDFIKDIKNKNKRKSMTHVLEKIVPMYHLISALGHITK